MVANPMISINVRVWMKLGYLYPTDRRRWLTVTPMIILSILQFNYCLFSGEDLHSVTLNAYFTALDVNCVVGGGFFTFNLCFLLTTCLCSLECC